LQRKLVQTEKSSRKSKPAQVVSVEETTRLPDPDFKWRDELVTAQVELTERKAVLGEGASAEVAAAATNASQASVPLEKVEEYTAILGT